MNQEEQYNALVLSRINYFSLTGLLDLYKTLGSATEVMRHRANIREVLPEASTKLVEALQKLDEPMRRAEEEMRFCERHQIRVLPYNDPAYPQRLVDCADAPIALFYRGTADLNARHTINLIGTRRATPYGIDLVGRFLTDLRELCPDALVFSGLAYGIDIAAHRAALANGFDTVGVLAQGLDDIYPHPHRDTAAKMVAQGGLLTEYMSGTKTERVNFVRRNRIVAGCSDATILVESAYKGGGLITCNIAHGYGRDVFAFPGSVGAPYSEGCNQLIRSGKAALITSARDFAVAMRWQDEARRASERRKGVERELFPTLTDEQQAIVNALRKHGDLQLSLLSAQTGMSITKLSALLFDLEMKGVLRTLAGGTYHLIG